jgi:formylmethanofuran dehydrogenase subunit A
MLTKIAGGRVIDPANRRDEIGDVWIRDGRIVENGRGDQPDVIYDAANKIVLAGAIDIHSHIAGGNVNTARLLLPDQHRPLGYSAPDTPLSKAGFSTAETGHGYARMGFTTVVEPAIVPHNAGHAHLELADIPIIDKAILCVLGNDEFLLRLLRAKESSSAIADYVAWSVQAAQALGVKVINAGGATAFKSNVRHFSLDDIVPFYGVSSREIVMALQCAVGALRIPHPLHVHCNNLGLPGNVTTALATIEASEDLPIHLAHLQFYGYGQDGKRGFSSAAAQLAEAVNAKKNVTVDIGQVMFGQTVTVSCDVLRQFSARDQASPKKWAIIDGDSNGGGIVPYRYRISNFYNAVQFAVGLELFLLINDPWRVFFTTDHPNGAPYTTYPAILALLSDRDLRAEWLSKLPADARSVTTLPSITREYSLTDIAIMTRAAPAKLLGLRDKGHLGTGAIADVAVYTPHNDRTKMFAEASLVFKSGDLVVRDGAIVRESFGRAFAVRPDFDKAVAGRMHEYYLERYGLSSDVFKVDADALPRPDPIEAVACAQ